MAVLRVVAHIAAVILGIGFILLAAVGVALFVSTPEALLRFTRIDPNDAAAASRILTGAGLLIAALIGIVFVGFLEALLSIEKHLREALRRPAPVPTHVPPPAPTRFLP
jgi:hypothetical protein